MTGAVAGGGKVDHIVLRATTGHQTEAMTEHYSHVSLEEKKQAAAKVVQMVGYTAQSKKGAKGGFGQAEKKNAQLRVKQAERFSTRTVVGAARFELATSIV